MTDASLSESQEMEMEVESHAPYLKVFGALLVLTIIEYFYAMLFQSSFPLLVGGLMFWAVVKASLVGWYFMHLKFEGNWVYGFLVPAGILACVVIFALIPDIALFKPFEENPAEEDTSPVSAVAPLVPGPARSIA
ncbi:MAG: cytochrome C oxidase subunit IV family protein [Isosphaeraceae bacterium]